MAVTGWKRSLWTEWGERRGGDVLLSVFIQILPRYVIFRYFAGAHFPVLVFFSFFDARHNTSLEGIAFFDQLIDTLRIRTLDSR